MERAFNRAVTAVTVTLLVAAGLLVASGPAHAADPALIALWKLDDGAGTTALDSSGYEQHGQFSTSGVAWVDDPERGIVGQLVFGGGNGRELVQRWPWAPMDALVHIGVVGIAPVPDVFGQEWEIGRHHPYEGSVEEAQRGRGGDAAFREFFLVCPPFGQLEIVVAERAPEEILREAQRLSVIELLE